MCWLTYWWKLLLSILTVFISCLYHKIMEARKGRSLLTNHNRVIPILMPLSDMKPIPTRCIGENVSPCTDPIPHNLAMGPCHFPASSVSSTLRYTWKTILLPCSNSQHRKSCCCAVRERRSWFPACNIKPFLRYVVEESDEHRDSWLWITPPVKWQHDMYARL